MDTRKINHGVWIDGELITDPDALAKAKLPAERMKQLEEQGAIEGFSSSKAEEPDKTDKPKKGK